jgi:hypothetical protein
MMLRRFAACVLVVTAAALAACRDTTGISAVNPVGADTLVAYALTGTDASLPSALNLVSRSTVRIGGTSDFDIAFDIQDSDTSVNILPARNVISSVFGTRQVGLQVVDTPFDQLGSAPDGYYRPDTTTNVKKGQTLVILSNRTSVSDICYYFASPHVYAKLVVDSVHMDTRDIYFRDVVDLNCGFRSFAPGYPKD